MLLSIATATDDTEPKKLNTFQQRALSNKKCHVKPGKGRVHKPEKGHAYNKPAPKKRGSPRKTPPKRPSVPWKYDPRNGNSISSTGKTSPKRPSVPWKYDPGMGILFHLPERRRLN